MPSRFVSPILLCLVLTTVLFAAGQTKPEQTDADKMIEVMRADLRADKVAIVTELMNLKGPEAEKFWPVYREYDLELTRLHDERIKIVKEYADQFATLTDAQAKTLVERMLAWESRRTQLRKTYFSKFATATSPVTAAKFIQIEHRLNLLVDLAVASELPGLFIKTENVAKE